MYESENNPIYLKWKTAGGKSIVGDALKSPQPILGGRSTYQTFTNGAIFNSPIFNAVFLSKPILTKWLSLKSDLQEYFGNPIGDSFKTAKGAQVAYFERGMIVVYPDGKTTIEVHGLIYIHYRKHNDVNGFLGLPLSDEESLPNGGYRSRFEGGDIYYHPDAGACAIYGTIREHWMDLSSIYSVLVYPTSDVQPVMKDGVQVGLSCRFQGGVIFWKPGIGAWEVHGTIREAWETLHGGATGHLGFPVSDEKSTPTSGGRYSNFEHGVIVWHPDGLYAGIHVFTTMELYVQRLIGTGGEEATGDSELDIYVFHHIEVQNRVEGNAVLSDGRQPKSGYWDESKVDVNWKFPVTDCVQGELQLIVMFEGWDDDDFGEDNRLGTINYGLHVSPYDKHLQPAYSVDNLWGRLEDLRHSHDAFHVDYIIREKTQPYDTSKAFREQWFWKFNNFKTPKLDKQTYADTFGDVDSQGIQWINPWSYADEGWESLYYHLVYKGAAKTGNCFGICLLAIYAMMQRSLFNEPIYRFGHPQADSGDPDPNLDRGIIREINIKHGYQVGADCIHWFLSQFFLGMTHNPREVFKASRAAHQRGDYPILSICQYWGANAHAVLPIHWNDQTEPWEIWIADPNFEWKPSEDSDSKYKILVYSDDNRFEYIGKHDYKGAEWTGARLFYTPYSVLNDEPRVPFWEILRLIVSGVIIMVGEDGETSQITDNAGRTFYEPNLPSAPTQWEHLRRDSSQRIPGLARVPLMIEEPTADPVPELYYFQGEAPTLKYQVRAKQQNKTYRWAMRSPKLTTIVTMQDAPTGTDIVAMEDLKTDKPAVSLEIAPNSGSRKINLEIHGWTGVNSAQKKAFKVYNLTLNPSHRFRLHLSEAGQALNIDNFGAKVTFQVSGNNSNKRDVTIEAGKSVCIRPQWQNLDAQWQIDSATASLRRFLESKGFDPGVGVRSPYPNVASLRDLMNE